MNFMKKIPPGAEASNVLVGEVDFLEKPIIAFVRLSPAVLITGLTEVPVPTRYTEQELNDIIRLNELLHYWPARMQIYMKETSWIHTRPF